MGTEKIKAVKAVRQSQTQTLILRKPLQTCLGLLYSRHLKTLARTSVSCKI